MPESVVDNSALMDALLREDETGDTIRHRLRGTNLHAPHLIEAEAGHALRKKVLSGEVPADYAPGRLRAVQNLLTERYPHGPLMELAWQLCTNVTFYDALYVALAARLRIPLLTTDGKLANAPDLPCTVEYVS